jgi:hypothetical protein
VEFFLDELPEGAAGELAWPDKKVAILVGDQWHLNSKWEEIGWQVVQGEVLAQAESVKEAVLKFYLVHLQ